MRVEDQILINEIRNGNRDVFKAIYHEYYSDLVKFAFGYLQDVSASQDIVQNFYLSLWQNIQNISINTSIKAYFYSSIKNRCLNKLRDINVNDKRNLIYLETMLALNVELENEDSILIEEVRDAIDKLPDQMKAVFVKKYFEGLKSKEIASQLDISENTVNTQLKRGKKKLKVLLLKTTRLNFML